MIEPMEHRLLDLGGWFCADDAVVSKNVRVGRDSSLWYGCVVRGDVASITIGARTNLQDLTVVHPESDVDLHIGDDVTVGHRAILHMKRLGSGSLVGMGAILLAHSEIGRECVIGAGALVREGAKVPDRSVLVGAPARVIRTVTDKEVENLRVQAARYAELARRHVRSPKHPQ